MKKFITVIFTILAISTMVKGQTSDPYARRIQFVTANPATCAIKRIFYNTTTGQFIICTATNTWTSSTTLTTGQFIAPDGTMALPSYSFINNPETGMYRPSNNQLAFATAGIKRIAITNSGSIIINANTSGSISFTLPGTVTTYSLTLPSAVWTGFLFNDGNGTLSGGVNNLSYIAPTSITNNGSVLATGSKNTAGKFTVTTTGASSVLLTFSQTWTRAPACMVTNETTANLARATSTTTTVTFTGVTANGDTLAYICMGY